MPIKTPEAARLARASSGARQVAEILALLTVEFNKHVSTEPLGPYFEVIQTCPDITLVNRAAEQLVHEARDKGWKLVAAIAKRTFLSGGGLVVQFSL
jgi:hypothetical protein